MGVRLDTDGQAHEDILDDARFARDRVEALDFDHRVQNDVTHPGLDRRGQLLNRFVVAVEGDPLRREVGVQRNGQLAAGADIEQRPSSSIQRAISLHRKALAA